MASLRTSVASGSWTNVGTSPATVQLISVGTPVMVACEASAPSTNSDGLILVNQGDSHDFQLASTNIWAQAVAGTATVACQPE